MNIKDAVKQLILPKALETVADKILIEAKNNCPVVTGNLKNSGRIIDEREGKTVAFAADYAYYVHENYNSRGFKFLEKAVLKISREKI